MVERALLRFRPLRPQYCSIYDPYFWWHERYWKLMAPLLGMFNGTPFKSPVWRLTGVRVGRRVFDDGCSIAERSHGGNHKLFLNCSTATYVIRASSRSTTRNSGPRLTERQARAALGRDQDRQSEQGHNAERIHDAFFRRPSLL